MKLINIFAEWNIEIKKNHEMFWWNRPQERMNVDLPVDQNKSCISMLYWEKGAEREKSFYSIEKRLKYSRAMGNHSLYFSLEKNKNKCEQLFCAAAVVWDKHFN